MIRTQISLTEEQSKFLAEFSHQSGESISAIIRLAVERLRAEQEPPDLRAMRLVGAFEADKHDVSYRHDEYLWGNQPQAPERRQP